MNRILIVDKNNAIVSRYDASVGKQILISFRTQKEAETWLNIEGMNGTDEESLFLSECSPKEFNAKTINALIKRGDM